MAQAGLTGFTELQAQLGPRLGTSRPVFALPGTADAGIELALRNLVRRQLLVVVAGDRGERAARIGEACGRGVVRACVQPGQVMRPEWLARFLDGPPLDAVLLVQVEPGFPDEAPMAELAAVARKQGLPVIADVSGAVGRRPVLADVWGLDVVIASSDDVRDLPAGLSVGAASARALDIARSMPARGMVLDLVAHHEAASRGEPLVPLTALRFGSG